ncbi:MAG: class I SAM-dependent methyltransferase [Proteobacteria bacterium]|nr:class I SAM-dependent methyltransferase [Pseudomonadota bacterium]
MHDTNQTKCGDIDFSALYDEHPEYVARRNADSLARAQIELEVRLFKLPGLMGVVPAGQHLRNVVEIGCATGELIATFPVVPGGRRVGLDISTANVATARVRFPEVEFLSGNFLDTGISGFDAVIVSDVIEHVSDDAEFLRSAAGLGNFVLVNLPLEDNWLNDRRNYGPDDVSGHLRRYSLEQGLQLFERAGLELLSSSQLWVHETPTESARRSLWRERTGRAYTGRWPVALGKRMVFATATAIRPIGRRLFASNLFAAVRRRSP